MCRVRAGVAVEVARFLVRKHKSGGAGDVFNDIGVEAGARWRRSEYLLTNRQAAARA